MVSQTAATLVGQAPRRGACEHGGAASPLASQCSSRLGCGPCAPQTRLDMCMQGSRLTIRARYSYAKLAHCKGRAVAKNAGTVAVAASTSTHVQGTSTRIPLLPAPRLARHGAAVGRPAAHAADGTLAGGWEEGDEGGESRPHAPARLPLLRVEGGDGEADLGVRLEAPRLRAPGCAFRRARPACETVFPLSGPGAAIAWGRPACGQSGHVQRPNLSSTRARRAKAIARITTRCRKASTGSAAEPKAGRLVVHASAAAVARTGVSMMKLGGLKGYSGGSKMRP